MEEYPKQTPEQQPAAPAQPAPKRGLQHLVAAVVGLALAASLVAVAAVTGLLPGLSNHTAPAGQPSAAVVAPPAAESASPAVQAAANSPTTSTTSTAPAEPAAGPPPVTARVAPGAQSPSPARARQPARPAARHAPRPAPTAVCRSCGTIQSVVALRRQGHGTGLGAIGGAVAGGLIGNQFGRGNGRTGMTVLGAAGGGYAGNSVERRLRSETDYRVRVRMGNGKIRYFTYRKPPPYRPGQRVRIDRGQLVGIR